MAKHICGLSDVTAPWCVFLLCAVVGGGLPTCDWFAVICLNASICCCNVVSTAGTPVSSLVVSTAFTEFALVDPFLVPLPSPFGCALALKKQSSVEWFLPFFWATNGTIFALCTLFA